MRWTRSGGEVSTIYSGTGRVNEPEPEPLSAIIDRLNARYGTDWTDADRLVFDAALDDLVADEQVQVTAVNNTAENFGVVFPELFQKALLDAWTATRRSCSSSSTTAISPPTSSRSTPPSP